MPAGLTIEVSDAVEQASSGDELTVAATLTNAGSENVDATLVLTAPSYASFAASEDAAISGSDASWSVSVGAGESRTVTASIAVGEIPESEYQLSTLASVYLGEVTGAPVIRAADVNEIPGRSNQVVPEAPSEAPSSSGVDPLLILGVAGVASALLAAAAAIVLVRRKRAGRTS